jgi:hypothetical protein
MHKLTHTLSFALYISYGYVCKSGSFHDAKLSVRVHPIILNSNAIIHVPRHACQSKALTMAL